MNLLNRYRLTTFFGPWVCLVIDLFEVLKIKVGVYLRGRDISMAQQFLDRPKISG